LDEAQRIKNTSSTSSQMARSISRSRSWALTGTPIEITPDDLVGIFEFLSPGYLRPGMPPKRLSDLVHDHILRRTQDMVLTDLKLPAMDGLQFLTLIRRQNTVVPVVMMTHEARERDMRAALQAIDKLPVVASRTTMIRVEPA